MFNKLKDHVTKKSVLGGDFNVILDETLDYESVSNNKYSNNKGTVRTNVQYLVVHTIYSRCDI